MANFKRRTAWGSKIEGLAFLKFLMDFRSIFLLNMVRMLNTNVFYLLRPLRSTSASTRPHASKFSKASKKLENLPLFLDGGCEVNFAWGNIGSTYGLTFAHEINFLKLFLHKILPKTILIFNSLMKISISFQGFLRLRHGLPPMYGLF